MNVAVRFAVRLALLWICLKFWHPPRYLKGVDLTVVKDGGFYVAVGLLRRDALWRRVSALSCTCPSGWPVWLLLLCGDIELNSK